jgi:hypothetical protein
MIALISLLFILGFSTLITCIASLALMHTGLSRDAARFQARSVFTGVGFTTNESEKVVNHPLRKQNKDSSTKPHPPQQNGEN